MEPQCHSRHWVIHIWFAFLSDRRGIARPSGQTTSNFLGGGYMRSDSLRTSCVQPSTSLQILPLRLCKHTIWGGIRQLILERNSADRLEKIDRTDRIEKRGKAWLTFELDFPGYKGIFFIVKGQDEKSLNRAIILNYDSKWALYHILRPKKQMCYFRILNMSSG